MQQRQRSNPSSPKRRRAPARWTIWEVLLVLASVVMIAFPLYATGLSIVSPVVAPAAPAAQPRATRTPSNTPDVTSAPPTDTSVPGQPTSTVAPPTDTSVPGQPTSTVAPPTDTSVPGQPTSTVAPPTDTSVPGQPTSTVAPPTDTSVPGGTATATLTPFVPPNEPPLQLLKFASVSQASPGQAFSYSLSVISTNSTAVQVSVSDNVSSQLAVSSASASNGSCSVSGQSVSCSVSVRDGSPASITIQVRARDTAQGNVTNQASASAAGTNAASESVTVQIVGGAVTAQPTVPTNTPGGPTGTSGPTNTPGGPTSTSGPTNTSGPPNTPQPSNTAGPDVPTATETSGDTGGNSGGGSSDNKKKDKATEVPPPPPPPPFPVGGEAPQPAPPQPTVAPQRPAATRRPAVATARPAAVVTARPIVTATGSAIAQQPSPTNAAPQPAPADTNVFFRIASDWGSAYPNQEVKYTLVLRNTRPANATSANLQNVAVSSNLPGNLDVLGATADRGDARVTGNAVQLTLAALAPGETVELVVNTRIKPNVPRGTLIVGQGQLRYDGLTTPLFSNVVTLLVVEAAPNAVTQTATAAGASPTLPPTLTALPTLPPTATAAIVPATATVAQGQQGQITGATRTPAPVAGGGTGGGTATLPATGSGAGVPLLGFALLGFTLLVRTLRLHRARARV